MSKTEKPKEKRALSPELVRFLQDFGMTVAKFRGTRGQAALAEAAGISQSAWSKLETGANGFDSETLLRVSRALGVEVYRLFGGLPPLKLLPSPAGLALGERWDAMTPEERKRFEGIAQAAQIDLHLPKSAKAKPKAHPPQVRKGRGVQHG